MFVGGSYEAQADDLRRGARHHRALSFAPLRGCAVVAGKRPVASVPKKARLDERRQDGAAQFLFQTPEAPGLWHRQPKSGHFEKLGPNPVNQMLQQPSVVFGARRVTTCAAEVDHAIAILCLDEASSIPR